MTFSNSEIGQETACGKQVVIRRWRDRDFQQFRRELRFLMPEPDFRVFVLLASRQRLGKLPDPAGHFREKFNLFIRWL